LFARPNSFFIPYFSYNISMDLASWLSTGSRPGMLGCGYATGGRFMRRAFLHSNGTLNKR
jgi:hypothetical protein